MANLFETDAYMKEFQTKIIRINKENKTIELEDTAFYAKGGGQPGDIGIIEIEGEEIRVTDTIKNEGSIINIVENLKNAEREKKIIGKIDWIKRYKHMRMHSALHLMCSIIPMSVTGGQIGFEKSRLDFNDPEKKIIKEEIQEKLNFLVKENHKITYELLDSKILQEKPEIVRTMSVKPPNINGQLRVVRIGNIDFQPCGGTHVKSTIEIGKIKIGKVENKGRMNRRVNILLND
ncbi:MAG: Alanine--tRNA ligase [Alphaproteobacteria bacterium MarineAlpha5_Bin5]|nr:MAG: Alanine--tRNA ligase [Alphaproteobacteria bacterium MarineAlpha5_Bin5]PPR48838.1 MAG: Alanine--tRNA ligase [Alphaproteobacteria bacterium MarineAlpha5_Bin4]|tara:strand:- start:815 stop:1516 length:702 start_codon:yes stop_codon:yes gene_type:complete